jgi:N6-adenosine-specific RNA methylase IME4
VEEKIPGLDSQIETPSQPLQPFQPATTSTTIGVEKRGKDGNSSLPLLSGGTLSVASRPYRVKIPDGPWGTILADPPWRTNIGGVKRKLHYDTMPLDDIKDMGKRIMEVSSPDAHLWLWATNPMLPEALEVVKSWGFVYRSMMTWDKERVGLGFWLRSATEHVIFATRSTKNRVQPSNISTIFRGEYRGHSVKPEGIVRIIEQLSPPPRLELFARSFRPGWTCLVSHAGPVGDPYKQG